MRLLHHPCLRPLAGRSLGRAPLGALLALLLALLLAPRARAEEPSPLDLLTPAERTVLEKKLPGLSSLPRERQEQIVRNVLHLRSLSGEDRARMLRRLQEAGEARVRGDDLGSRLEAWGALRGNPDGQGVQMKLTLGMRALASLAWDALPEDMRADPRVRGLGERAFAVGFHRAFWGAAVRGQDAAAALAYQPPAWLPESVRGRVDDLKRRVAAPSAGEGERAKLQSRLAEQVLQCRALEAVRAALGGAAPQGPREPGAGEGGPPLSGEGLRALGRALSELAPEAYAKALQQGVTLWREKGGERWAEAMLELGRPPAPPPEVQRQAEALAQVFAVEHFLARRPGLADEAEPYLRALVVGELGMPEADYAALPPRSAEAGQPDRRREAFLRWAKRSLPAEVLQHAFGRRQGAAGERGWTPGGLRGGGLLPGGRRGEGPRREPGAPPEPSTPK